MATLVNVGSHEAFAGELRKLGNPELIAQQCTQQGAIHAVAWLLRNGVTPDNASAQLASLRRMAQLMRDEMRRRGLQDPYPEDQTGFS